MQQQDDQLIHVSKSLSSVAIVSSKGQHHACHHAAAVVSSEIKSEPLPYQDTVINNIIDRSAIPNSEITMLYSLAAYRRQAQLRNQ